MSAETEYSERAVPTCVSAAALSPVLLLSPPSLVCPPSSCSGVGGYWYRTSPLLLRLGVLLLLLLSVAPFAVAVACVSIISPCVLALTNAVLPAVPLLPLPPPPALARRRGDGPRRGLEPVHTGQRGGGGAA